MKRIYLSLGILAVVLFVVFLLQGKFDMFRNDPGQPGAYKPQWVTADIKNTNCSSYTGQDSMTCNDDIANTLYTNFTKLSPEEQLSFDCNTLKSDFQKSLCTDQKRDLPRTLKSIDIYSRVAKGGLKVCNELDTKEARDSCSIGYALGRYPTPEDIAHAGSGQVQKQIPGCAILSDNLKQSCEQELEKAKLKK